MDPNIDFAVAFQFGYARQKDVWYFQVKVLKTGQLIQ